jgi:hypothetical protein
VETFNCQGDVSLIGSPYERQMAYDYDGTSPIEIKQPSYGGHYVFGLEAAYSNFYVRVKNRYRGQPLEYLINYYYY